MKTDLIFTKVETDKQIAITAGLANTIWHECFAKLLSPDQIDYMVDKFQSAPAMTRQIRDEGYEYFLVEMPNGAGGHTPGAYVGIQAKDGKLLLSKLYMLDEHRGKGYARDIMAFVEQAGRERGCVGVWLTVNRHNERAIAVYHKTGFELTREQVQDIGGGYVMDDFIFEKSL
ncbi:GNAT family N-acetyltransferase [Ruminococcaceae bacterium OttesenSCG-928-D13]|nr:GNAT family N-acetyltransferase [Ruminococcaceae bacterium OttesenSCG-928-D13]